MGILVSLDAFFEFQKWLFRHDGINKHANASCPDIVKRFKRGHCIWTGAIFLR